MEKKSRRSRRVPQNRNEAPTEPIDLESKTEKEKDANITVPSVVINENETEKKAEEEIQCGICFEKLEIQGILDSCQHLFCFLCIEHWSKTSNTCPMCKARFRQLTKKDLSKPEQRTKKYKIKDVDQAVANPESYFVWDEEDEEQEQDPILSMLPALLGPSLLGLSSSSFSSPMSMSLVGSPFMHMNLMLPSLTPPPPQPSMQSLFTLLLGGSQPQSSINISLDQANAPQNALRRATITRRTTTIQTVRRFTMATPRATAPTTQAPVQTQTTSSTTNTNTNGRNGTVRHTSTSTTSRVTRSSNDRNTRPSPY